VNISTESLKYEIIVAYNCLKETQTDFNTKMIINAVEKHIYPNSYKLLQIALTIPLRWLLMAII